MTTFRVIGQPAAQGSKRAYVRGGRAVVVESSPKVRPWRQDVRQAATDALSDPIAGPVHVSIIFWFTRPKGHIGRAGNVLPSAPRYKVTAPDLDKLIRSTLDALSGVAFGDDSQVVSIAATKRWSEWSARPGATITIVRLAGSGTTPDEPR